jgi:hypothetical protein
MCGQEKRTDSDFKECNPLSVSIEKQCISTLNQATEAQSRVISGSQTGAQR